MKLTIYKGRKAAFSCTWVLKNVTRKIRAKLKVVIDSNDKVCLTAGEEIEIHGGVKNSTAPPDNNVEIYNVESMVDNFVRLGGPSWTVQLGRRDSTTANFTAANTDLPSPFLNLSGLMAAFRKKNFTAEEMVTASGAHTIGDARCTTFRTRIYDEMNINPGFESSLKSNSPVTRGDNNLSPLDVTTQNYFNNACYKNLLNKEGLLRLDQQLYNGSSIDSQVESYSSNLAKFLADFSNAMVKMGNLSPLTGSSGQIRYNYRKIN
ncbi:hypothetical protein Nepgr_017075 [Nepenthes gracilis]|uniref:peroxidase n=1 Tax=Nepenthes gracilis TaxID=150966 RepID=A0AAD3SQV9_NEPGR|nr:hypothetical protein Nepgr_017075 [Nepenthes gracilis]